MRIMALLKANLLLTAGAIFNWLTQSQVLANYLLATFCFGTKVLDK